MKTKITTSFILFLCAMQLQAQLNSYVRAVFGNNNVYRTHDTLVLKRIYNHEQDTIIKENIKFKLIVTRHTPVRFMIKEDGDNPIIWILPKIRFIYHSHVDGTATITDSVDIVTTTGAVDDSTDNYYFQFVSKPTSITKVLISESLVGLPFTMPLKYRPHNIDDQPKLYGTFNLSYAFGYRLKLYKSPFIKKYINTVVGVGLGSDKYFAKSTDEKKDAIALTYFSMGITYEVRSLNFGAFFGFDKMFGAYKNWAYQDKVWYSFGIGYKFNK